MDDQNTVLALQEQIRVLESRLEILRTQIRDILKVQSMEEELKNWELFAIDLLHPLEARKFQLNGSYTENFETNNSREATTNKNPFHQCGAFQLCENCSISMTPAKRMELEIATDIDLPKPTLRPSAPSTPSVGCDALLCRGTRVSDFFDLQQELQQLKRRLDSKGES